MADFNEENLIQALFHLLLIKHLPTWADATKFGKEHGINENTMKAAYYKDGQVGIQAMNQIVTPLLKLDSHKLSSIMNSIHQLEPIAESLVFWNKLDCPENMKLRLARYALAISQVEDELKKAAKK